MTTLRILVALAGLLIATITSADTTTLTIPAGTGQAVNVAVPRNARLLTLTASVANGRPGQLDMYARPSAGAGDTGFNVAGDLPRQADYHSSDAAGKARLAISDLHATNAQQVRWYVVLANHGSNTAEVTLTTAIKSAMTSTSNTPETVFNINFNQPSAAVKKTLGGTSFDCDTAPWHDQTPLDSNGDGNNDTTLGAFRESLLQQAAAKLATQVHTPIPINVQACWKKYGDANDAKHYTLAAAGPTYLFYDIGGSAKPNTWYAAAPTERIAGASLCNLDNSIPCGTPDIIVTYNSDTVAQKSYDGASDEPLIISTTMHELTHGLGFLSQVNTGGSEKYKDDPTKDPNFSDLYKSRHDAFTDLVAYSNNGNVTSYNTLGKSDRTAALTSGTSLVLNDPDLANNPANSQHANAFPANLVQLYAPTTVEPGSTLSHFNDDTHPGQLMDHFIQHNFPTTLGLAEPVLEQVGWSTGPTHAPLAGAWYDPTHSGHGIDFEPIVRDPAGDQYSVEFYTFNDAGQPTFYFSSGRLRDGHYESIATAGTPAQLYRPKYEPLQRKAVIDPDYSGTMSLDFTSYAAADPACAGRSGPTLALLHWTINGNSGTWCITPLLAAADRPAAISNLNGLWNGGANDSGWGMSIVNKAGSTSPALNPVLLYYYDSDNKSRWAEAAYPSYAAGSTTTLYALGGYCRLCSKPAGSLPATAIGTLMLDLNKPDGTAPPSGVNTVSFTIDAGMLRNSVPVRLYSLPPGK